MRKLLLLGNFLVIAPCVFLFAIIFLLFVTYQTYTAHQKFSQSQAVHYAALPTTENIFSSEIISKDSRVDLLTQFFRKYKSPLEPYTKLIVDTADQYDIDFRLIPAIAMQESNVCHKIPKNSYNCWGFGIYGGKITHFSGYEEAIQTVSKTLSLQYKNKGYVTPEQIMSKYTPSSKGSWALGVHTFMNELE